MDNATAPEQQEIKISQLTEEAAELKAEVDELESEMPSLRDASHLRVQLDRAEANISAYKSEVAQSQASCARLERQMREQTRSELQLSKLYLRRDDAAQLSPSG